MVGIRYSFIRVDFLREEFVFPFDVFRGAISREVEDGVVVFFLRTSSTFSSMIIGALSVVVLLSSSSYSLTLARESGCVFTTYSLCV